MTKDIRSSGSINSTMADTAYAVTEREAGDRLHLSIATLRAWRHRKVGPKFVRFGRAIRYLPIDLDAYVAASRVNTGAELELPQDPEAREVGPR